MAKNWAEQNRHLAREAMREPYGGSFVKEPAASAAAMRILSERMAATGPIFHWNHGLDSGRNLGLIVSNVPGILSNVLLFDSADKADSESLLQISHSPVEKMRVPNSDGGEDHFERGQLYVGGFADIAQFVGILCESMETGSLASEIVFATKTAHANHGPSYSQEPDRSEKFRNEFRVRLNATLTQKEGDK